MANEIETESHETPMKTELSGDGPAVGVVDAKPDLPVSPTGNTSKTGSKSSKSRKRTKLKKKEKEQMYMVLMNKKDTSVLVATLIATFTYTSGINPPGGVYQDGLLIGTAVAARTTAFKVFSVCDNIALCLSLTVVLRVINKVPYNRKFMLMTTREIGTIISAAIFFVTIAYVAAAFVIVKPAPPRRGLDWTTVFLLCAIACTVGSLLAYQYVFSVLLCMGKCPPRAWAISSDDDCDETSSTKPNQGNT